ncbi:hypothetical protein SDC9_203879 [bioreactor metagenome]|uniref:Glyoxalase/fosfomycin resistance/dioxygenase domain-containing protein n=1 Tax=bioreactor metagenome TaxID=1076179 RepID=A0A645J9K6_9ZZZZ
MEFIMSNYPKLSVAFEIAYYNEDRIQAFELYQKAFNAKKISEFSPEGPDPHNLHILMEINGFEILLHPSKEKRERGVVGCQLHFDNEDDLRKAYDILIKEGQNYSIGSYPHAPVSALVTDKYGVGWWLHT